MVDASRRAAAKGARGGRSNALFVVAAAETFPTELWDIAGAVTVNFPWGSLLRGLLAQDMPILAGLGRLLGPNGRLEAVVSAVARDGLTLPDESDLLAGYRAAGLDLSEYRQATGEEIANRRTSWARRLGAGRDRPVWRIVAVALAERQHRGGS